MRTLKLFLAGTAILALLGFSGGAVLAQAEDETLSPVVVTGTLDCSGEAAEDTAAADAGISVHAWEASDARLSGEVEYTGRWQLYEEPTEDRGDAEASQPAVYEIVNEGGGWLCQAARAAEPRVSDRAHTLVFSGQEGYEGMTAYLHVDWSTTPHTFTGLILPGEAPGYAEPQG